MTHALNVRSLVEIPRETTLEYGQTDLSIASLTVATMYSLNTM